MRGGGGVSYDCLTDQGVQFRSRYSASLIAVFEKLKANLHDLVLTFSYRF